jgi:nanoRNase/pAp phosphatase (c-di-AMP/oligoRNAs hydrolase)
MEDDNGAVEPRNPVCFKNFLKLLESKKTTKKAALFTHAMPDPDALGSIMGMQWMLQKYGIESEGFYDGTISHPQNRAMVNLLDPNIQTLDKYKSEEFDFHILVDTVPANAGVGDNKICWDLVIDHHREIPNGGFNGVFVNLKAGSCCGTVYSLIKKLGYKFEDDNDADSKVATGIMVGISTDTESLMSDDTTNYEFNAWSELFDFREPNVIKKIIHWEKPKFWIDHEAEAVKNALTNEGIGVVGLGIIPARHRDMIADMADAMVGWEDVNTAVAFAVVDGDRLEGSVRSRNASIMVPQLCKEFAGKFGCGGGKLGKGAYRYPLAGGSIEEEDDDETKVKTWELYNEKEQKRIMRVLRK